MKATPLNIFLVISLAFNIAFVAAFGLAYLSWASSESQEGTKPPVESTAPWWTQEDLHLTDRQQRTFRETDAELFEQINQIEEHVAEHRQHLVELLAREDGSHQEIETVLTEIMQLQRQAQTLVVDSLVAKHALLGSDQKQAFVGCLRRQLRCGEQCPDRQSERCPRWRRDKSRKDER